MTRNNSLVDGIERDSFDTRIMTVESKSDLLLLMLILNTLISLAALLMVLVKLR